MQPPQPFVIQKATVQSNSQAHSVFRVDPTSWGVHLSRCNVFRVWAHVVALHIELSGLAFRFKMIQLLLFQASRATHLLCMRYASLENYVIRGLGTPYTDITRSRPNIILTFRKLLRGHSAVKGCTNWPELHTSAVMPLRCVYEWLWVIFWRFSSHMSSHCEAGTRLSN